MMHIKGYGSVKSLKIAIEWFTKAEAQGDAMANCFLGNFYRNGRVFEKNVVLLLNATKKPQGKAVSRPFIL